MDEAARRREAMRARMRARDHARAREAYAATVPLLAALDAAGEEYRSGGYDRLSGAANRWAHDPRVGWAEQRVLPIGLAAMLRARGEATLTVVVRSEALVVEAPAPALLRHVEALLATAGREALALLAPPGRWLVVVERGVLVEGMLEA